MNITGGKGFSIIKAFTNGGRPMAMSHHLSILDFVTSNISFFLFLILSTILLEWYKLPNFLNKLTLTVKCRGSFQRKYKLVFLDLEMTFHLMKVLKDHMDWKEINKRHRRRLIRKKIFYWFYYKKKWTYLRPRIHKTNKVDKSN